ncbi:MAG: Ig-like domain-containing protein, partial [Cytophaga sp.]|uniref:Ig-like domain-containing protein n=1 Tax=Cytophaga sp. TaxID=29535 RepID=UPI003F8212EC
MVKRIIDHPTGCRLHWSSTVQYRFIIFCIITFFTFLPTVSFSQSYTWGNVPIGGGGFVTGIVTHKTSGDRYCRTDVGGAYRWDEANNKWVQLMDWLNESENGFIGVEALAVDPQNANNVYMLCGTSYINGGRTAILKSTDKGNTFTYTDVTSKFKAHGNGSGRGNGERLAVDPKNSNILFCGTRANGLWKSTDAGVTWNLAWNGVTSTANGNGICFVLFDPSGNVTGGASQTIYLGVSRTGGANIYKSTDGGVTFNDISPNTGFMPHRAALQGTTMYVSLADTEGPATNGYGKLYKLNTSTGTWTNVTPGANATPAQGRDYPYGGISIDPTNVNRVIVSTCGMYWNNSFGTGWGDFVFLSNDGGATWTLKNGNNATYDSNGMAWSCCGAVNWMDCIEFDQNNPLKVRVVGGGGVYTCPDISATNPSWKYDVKGIEETAFLDGISIPGGSLISSFGDITGFVHEPLMSYPSKKLSPSDGNNQSIAYAGANTNRVVRASNGGNVVYYSGDKGNTWTGCTTNKGSDGRVSISADGGTILHCPGGSSTTYYTTDNGANWSSCSGVSLGDAAPVADQVNSNYFYIYHPSAGQMYRSSNKGVNFSVAGSPGASTANYPWESVLVRTVPGLEGHIWVPLGRNGLKYSTNYGATYTTISNVSYCKSIGIGKAIAGATYPCVFIWGTVGGVTGLFRSTDQGATWLRVNDDAHQFAGAPLLIGDMNVAGKVFLGAGGGRGIIYWEPLSGNTPPAVNLTVPAVNSSFCQGTSINLTATATDSDGSITKVEFYDGTTLLGTATSSPYTYNWANAAVGTHTITAKATDNAGGISTSASAGITVNALPVITSYTQIDGGAWNQSSTAIVCAGSTVALGPQPTVNTGWSWIGPNGYTATTREITLSTITTAQAGTYTASYTDGNSCKSSTGFILTVNTLPTAAITTTTPTTFCQGGSVVLTSSAGSSYKWLNGTTVITGATAQTYTATTAGNYTVEVTNANNCKATSSVTTVTVNTLPTAAITTTTPTTFCQGGSVVLTSSAGSSYKWLNGATA